jgi:hypothetical protein
VEYQLRVDQLQHHVDQADPLLYRRLARWQGGLKSKPIQYWLFSKWWWYFSRIAFTVAVSLSRRSATVSYVSCETVLGAVVCDEIIAAVKLEGNNINVNIN